MAYSVAMRIFAGLMMILFLICVGLQYNDPDPLLWMVVYGFAAGLCLAVVLRKPIWVPALMLTLLCLVWALFLFSGVVGKVKLNELAGSMKAENPAIEEARESGGLLIIAITMTVFLIPRKT